MAEDALKDLEKFLSVDGKVSSRKIRKSLGSRISRRNGSKSRKANKTLTNRPRYRASIIKSKLKQAVRREAT